MTQITKSDAGDPTLKYVSYELLDFDPENPRFAGEMAGRAQDEIQKLLFKEPHYASELVDSLVENGFIDYEPLVVKQRDGRYVVVEGNRRLAAIQEIHLHPDKYSGRKSDLTRIPVLIFPDHPDEQQQNEMRVYLGVRHLLGFREWPPISKAQYLERESKSPGGLERVIKETRLAKNQVRRFLVPYRLLKNAHIQLPKGEDFWVLGEALGRSGVKKFLQLDIDSETLEVRNYSKPNLSLLLKDLYGPPKGKQRDASEKVVYDTRDLSRLSKILESEKAAAVLHSGKGLEEAELYVVTREQSFTRLTQVAKEIGFLLKQLTKGTKSPEAIRLLEFFKTFDTALKKYIGRAQ